MFACTCEGITDICWIFDQSASSKDKKVELQPEVYLWRGTGSCRSHFNNVSTSLNAAVWSVWSEELQKKVFLEVSFPGETLPMSNPQPACQDVGSRYFWSTMETQKQRKVMPWQPVMVDVIKRPKQELVSSFFNCERSMNMMHKRRKNSPRCVYYFYGNVKITVILKWSL